MSAYTEAGHRIQTAIAFLMGRDPDYTATQPKHLRVGLDLSKSDMAGLVTLLIAKGVFTEAEYIDAITAAADAEANSYEKIVQSVIGSRNTRTADERCPQCGAIGLDYCGRATCAWDDPLDSATDQQRADGAAFADRMNAWIAERDHNDREYWRETCRQIKEDSESHG